VRKLEIEIELMLETLWMKILLCTKHSFQIYQHPVILQD